MPCGNKIDLLTNLFVLCGMESPSKKGIGLRFALKGIWLFFRDGRNAKIHLVAAILVIASGIYLDLNLSEWLWISLAIALVFITEMLNTSLELLCDLVMQTRHPTAGKLNDGAAGAVLVAEIFALLVGGILFGNPFF